MSKKLANLIPAEDIDHAERWALPQMEGKAPRIKSAVKERRERQQLEKQRADEIIEDVNIEDIPSSALTAEQMQEITEAAEKEGYAKGHQEGLLAGKDAGYKAGQQQGLKEMKASLTLQQTRFTQLANALLNPIEEQDDALEQALLASVVSIASGVIKRELFADSSHIQSLVQEAIAALPAGAKNIRIILHPDDLAMLEQYLEEDAPRAAEDWQFFAEASMTPGGCKVETAQSLIDFSVERRMSQILNDFTTKQLGNDAKDDDRIEDLNGEEEFGL